MFFKTVYSYIAFNTLNLPIRLLLITHVMLAILKEARENEYILPA